MPTPNRSCNCCWLFTPYRISMPRVKQWQLIGLVCSAWSKCRCQVGCIPASSIRQLICVQSFLTHNLQGFFKFRLWHNSGFLYTNIRSTLNETCFAQRFLSQYCLVFSCFSLTYEASWWGVSLLPAGGKERHEMLSLV